MKRHATRTLRVVFQRTVLIAVAVIIGAVLGTLFSTRAYYGEQRHENVALKDKNAALVASAAEAEARAEESADQLVQTEEALSSTKSSLSIARQTTRANRRQAAKLTSKLRVVRHKSATAYSAGEAAGYQQGKDEGYSTGYDVGYDEGLADGSVIVDGGGGGGGSPDCDPNYSGCLDPNAADYDCSGGSGDGPEYTGPVEVLGYDEYDLDADGDGYACE